MYTIYLCIYYKEVKRFTLDDCLNAASETTASSISRISFRFSITSTTTAFSNSLIFRGPWLIAKWRHKITICTSIISLKSWPPIPRSFAGGRRVQLEDARPSPPSTATHLIQSSTTKRLGMLAVELILRPARDDVLIQSSTVMSSDSVRRRWDWS